MPSKSPLRKPAVQLTLITAALGGLLIGFYMLMHQQRNKLALPPNMTSLEGFTMWMNSDDSWECERFSRNGKSYTMARKHHSPLAFATGAAAYVFDASGKLEDWTIDDAESEEWFRKWGDDGKKKAPPR